MRRTSNIMDLTPTRVDASLEHVTIGISMWRAPGTASVIGTPQWSSLQNLFLRAP